MSAEVWFDTQDVVKTSQGGGTFVVKNVLFIHLRKAPVHDSNGTGFEFDGPAEERHLRDYNAQLKRFLGTTKTIHRGFVVIDAEPEAEVKKEVKEAKEVKKIEKLKELN